jgi:hypothetical protein
MQLDLRGRKPEQLTNKSIIKDILLELSDTNKFDISIETISDINYRANNKCRWDYSQRGEVIVHECDWKPQTLNGNLFSQTTISLTEKRWDICRYPMRIKVVYKGYTSDNISNVYDISNSVFLRLKDYIGVDEIQSQFLYTNFMIDFINSDCQLIIQKSKQNFVNQ